MEIDTIYFAFGNVVEAVAYRFPGTTDPRFTENYARKAEQRLRDLCSRRSC